MFEFLEYLLSENNTEIDTFNRQAANMVFTLISTLQSK